MGDRLPTLEKKHIEFIEKQHLFFVGTAGKEGTVNVSPKGMDTFRVLGPKKVCWLNQTGSGNETSVHVQENGRMTIMFCSFDKQPLILRIYGDAKVIHQRDARWEDLKVHFEDSVGIRQFFEMNVDLVQTSCGYAVPFYDYQGEREALTLWANKRGRAGIEDYWKEENQISLDGKQTNILG